MMEKGKIIFLNGVSSAGKSTLAKALQDSLDEPYYLLANDTFCDMSPEKFIDIDIMGTYRRALSGLHHTIRAFSDAGIHTIVDHVMVKSDACLGECLELLHDHPVLFVHVTCPLEELRRRELERGDRGIGQAESQLAGLEPQDTIYDITVDTFHQAAEECAQQIRAAVAHPENFTAFRTLHKNGLP